jgi:hypothetical protein
VAIRTPDQRLRVFVSSTLGELADERQAVQRAISSLRLTPVMFESGARSHPARDVYQAYLAQSDIFIGLYWQRYGQRNPDMDEPLWMGTALITLSGFEVAAGQFDDAADDLDQVRLLADRFDHGWLAVSWHVQLSALALARGRLDEARDRLDEALDLSLAIDSTQGMCLALAAGDARHRRLRPGLYRGGRTGPAGGGGRGAIICCACNKCACITSPTQAVPGPTAPVRSTPGCSGASATSSTGSSS